jgi:hypothetical protein
LPAKVETDAAEREAAAKRGRRRRSMGVERKMEDGRKDERGMMRGRCREGLRTRGPEAG